MQKMDLKASLLLGINEIIPIVRYKRLTINKQSYSIKYVIKGRMLMVHHIKRIVKRNTLGRLLKVKKCRFLRRMMRMRKAALHSRQQKQLISVSVQTADKDMQDASVETMTTYKTNKWTNTHHVWTFPQSSQTEIKNTTMSTQCRVPLYDHCAQTEFTTTEVSTQMEIKLANKECQTTAKDLLNGHKVQAEYNKVVILLNELSKLLLSQNHLLSNNCTLVGQLSELSLHTRVADRQKFYMHCLKKVQKQRWARQYTRVCGKRRYVFTVKTPQKITVVDCCTIAQQTDVLEMKTKYTQTYENAKSNFFPGFFKSNSSSHRTKKIK